MVFLKINSSRKWIMAGYPEYDSAYSLGHEGHSHRLELRVTELVYHTHNNGPFSQYV